MAIRTLDVLHVRTFNSRDGDRIVVDFDEDPTTDRFIAFSPEGAVICVGMERIKLGWDALAQLTELTEAAQKSLKPPVKAKRPSKARL